MIVWFNCKISDIRPNPQPRYHLRNDNRFDIARYSFASFKPLEPLVSKFIFNLEMADGHAHQQQEMEEWLTGLFPAEKLSLHWHRCNNITQWQEVQKEINAIDDPLVFPAGNEDHIFMDSDSLLMIKAKIAIKKINDPAAVFMTSHYPESIRAAYEFNGIPITDNLIRYSAGNNDALRIMKKEFFNWYIAQIKDPEMFLFRTEHWNSVVLPNNLIYVPTKEQFRHFDGYAHVGIGPDYAPPLEIPPGFFEKNITIKYGFNEHDKDCVNINPCTETLYAADGQGTDYKWTLKDIPAFWKPYIKDIIVAPGIDEDAMAAARDKNLLVMSRLTFDWPHMGLKFDESNYPPVEWLNPHMQALEFTN
jgi:hypothetical protein